MDGNGNGNRPAPPCDPNCGCGGGGQGGDGTGRTPLERLLERMRGEYDEFVGETLKKPPKGILEAAYEKVFKEELVIIAECDKLTDEQVAALLTLDNPLDELYWNWLDTDVSFTDILEDTVDEYTRGIEESLCAGDGEEPDEGDEEPDERDEEERDGEEPGEGEPEDEPSEGEAAQTPATQAPHAQTPHAQAQTAQTQTTAARTAAAQRQATSLLGEVRDAAREAGARNAAQAAANEARQKQEKEK
jgi:hypothetical protein